VLALIEFEGVDTLFLARLMGVDPAEASLDWIGMTVQARYRRNSSLLPRTSTFSRREGMTKPDPAIREPVLEPVSGPILLKRRLSK